MAEMMTRWMNPFDDPFFRGFFDRELDRMTTADNLPLDMYEKDNVLHVKAQLPEMEAKDVKITVEGDILRIAADKKEEKETKDKNYYMKEYRTQAWRRSIRLPHPVNADAADATFDKGMLTITFPMKAEPKTKTIALH